MKKLLATGLVGAALASSANGQGTIFFSNYFTGTAADPRVYFNDWATPVSGSNYVAQLIAGPTPGSMNVVSAPVPFLGYGYFVGGVVSIPGVPGGGTAYLTVVVWDTTLGGTTTGATSAEAFAYKQSGHGNIWAESGVDGYGVVHPFTAITGDPMATPPTAPGLLDGMQSFGFDPVPEPPVLSMTALGLLGFVLWRNRARKLGTKSKL